MDSITIVAQVPKANAFKILALKLKLARDIADVTQRQLGDECGVAESTIGYWERSGNIPGAYFEAIANATGQSMDYFRI